MNDYAAPDAPAAPRGHQRAIGRHSKVIAIPLGPEGHRSIHQVIAGLMPANMIAGRQLPEATPRPLGPMRTLWFGSIV